ncbi:MAG: hypothetical protein ACOYOT_04370 [Bacteroidales bacterium]
MSEKQKFFFKLNLLSVIVLATAVLLYSTLLKGFYFKIFPVLFLLVYGVTSLSYLRLIKVADQNMLRFSSAYMQSTLVKFLVYMTFMLVCLLTKSVANVLSFVMAFFVMYLIFTIFEVTQVLSFYNKGKGIKQ